MAIDKQTLRVIFRQLKQLNPSNSNEQIMEIIASELGTNLDEVKLILQPESGMEQPVRIHKPNRDFYGLQVKTWQAEGDFPGHVSLTLCIPKDAGTTKFIKNNAQNLFVQEQTLDAAVAQQEQLPSKEVYIIHFLPPAHLVLDEISVVEQEFTSMSEKLNTLTNMESIYSGVVDPNLPESDVCRMLLLLKEILGNKLTSKYPNLDADDNITSGKLRELILEYRSDIRAAIDSHQILCGEIGAKFNKLHQIYSSIQSLPASDNGSEDSLVTLPVQRSGFNMPYTSLDSYALDPKALICKMNEIAENKHITGLYAKSAKHAEQVLQVAAQSPLASDFARKNILQKANPNNIRKRAVKFQENFANAMAATKAAPIANFSDLFEQVLDLDLDNTAKLEGVMEGWLHFYTNTLFDYYKSFPKFDGNEFSLFQRVMVISELQAMEPAKRERIMGKMDQFLKQADSHIQSLQSLNKYTHLLVLQDRKFLELADIVEAAKFANYELSAFKNEYRTANPTHNSEVILDMHNYLTKNGIVPLSSNEPPRETATAETSSTESMLEDWSNWDLFDTDLMAEYEAEQAAINQANNATTATSSPVQVDTSSTSSVTEPQTTATSARPQSEESGNSRAATTDAISEEEALARKAKFFTDCSAQFSDANWNAQSRDNYRLYQYGNERKRRVEISYGEELVNIKGTDHNQLAKLATAVASQSNPNSSVKGVMKVKDIPQAIRMIQKLEAQKFDFSTIDYVELKGSGDKFDINTLLSNSPTLRVRRNKALFSAEDDKENVDSLNTNPGRPVITM